MCGWLCGFVHCGWLGIGDVLYIWAGVFLALGESVTVRAGVIQAASQHL